MVLYDIALHTYWQLRVYIMISCLICGNTTELGDIEYVLGKSRFRLCRGHQLYAQMTGRGAEVAALLSPGWPLGAPQPDYQLEVSGGQYTAKYKTDTGWQPVPNGSGSNLRTVLNAAYTHGQATRPHVMRILAGDYVIPPPEGGYGIYVADGWSLIGEGWCTKLLGTDSAAYTAMILFSDNSVSRMPMMLSNLQMNGNGASGAGIQSRRADNITISAVRLLNIDNYGISVSVPSDGGRALSNIYIADCLLENIAYSAIAFSTDNTRRFTKVRVEQCVGIDVVTCNGYGIIGNPYGLTGAVYIAEAIAPRVAKIGALRVGQDSPQEAYNVAGVHLRECDYFHVSDCEIYNSVGQLYLVHDSYHGRLLRLRGANAIHSGLYMEDAGASEIRDVEFSDLGDCGVVMGVGPSITFERTPSGSQIIDVRITRCGWQGVNGVSDHTWLDNVVVVDSCLRTQQWADGEKAGILLYGIRNPNNEWHASGARFNKVTRCTVVGDEQDYGFSNYYPYVTGGAQTYYGACNILVDCNLSGKVAPYYLCGNRNVVYG